MADFDRADLSGADLSRAILTGADLTKASLVDIYDDSSTIWPTGFRPPPSRATS